MKKPWLWMLISGLIALGAGWAVNQYRFGGASQFGPIGTDSDLSAENSVDYLTELAPSKGNPKAVVAGELTHDFGIMLPGSEGEKVFEISNEGTSDLLLSLGASTCKCTIGSLGKESIEPGEKTTVKLNWTIKPSDSGFSQSAEILTNDPSQPALRFDIVGMVVHDIDVVPSKWTFGEVASGDSFEVAGKIYSYLGYDIEPDELSFSMPEMTEHADFTVEAFEPTEEADGIRSAARQAFRVYAKVSPGLPQGPISPKLTFPFHRIEQADDAVSTRNSTDAANLQFLIPVSGRIVGPLSMIVNDQVTEAAGSYTYDFGRIQENDPRTATAFIVLRGKDRDNVSLRIGEVSPDGVVVAKLGKPKGSGSMKLFPLAIELIPGSESVERKGLSKDDYGSIWIESDNPNVSKMRVALKFSLDGR